MEEAEYLETLAQRHADRLGIPIESARNIVNAVAVSSETYMRRRTHLLEASQITVGRED